MSNLAWPHSALGAAVALGFGLVAGHAAAIDLEFVTHVEVDMWEQDVYVEFASESGKGRVFRVGPDDYEDYLDAPTFATTHTVHHDPANPNAIGPYPQGAELGMTMGEWLAASGTGNYQCNGDTGRIETSFKNLVPRGVYTVWYFFVPTPSAEPFSTYDLPLGDRAGRENFFTASSDGSADYSLELASCLQGSGSQLTAGLALAWHSDGATYGSNPGGFGRASHVHLFVMLPDDDALNR